MRHVVLATATLTGLLGSAYALTPLRERLTPAELAGDDCFVQVQGYRLHYHDTGPRDAPVVLLLHGFAAWSFTWRLLAPVLVAAGLRVICVDQIGYGASDRPAAAVYTTAHQAALQLGALDALGVGQASLVGHSFGGRVALQIALAAPDRVQRIVAICPEAFATARPPIGRLVAVPLLGYALAFYTLAPPLVATGLRSLSGDTAWVTPEVAAGYAAPLAVRGTAAAQVWQARSPKDGARPVPHHLADIRQPTLLLWGARDQVFPLEEGRRLIERLPNAQLQVLAGAGHLPHEEQPGEVERAVVGFVKEA